MGGTPLYSLLNPGIVFLTTGRLLSVFSLFFSALFWRTFILRKKKTSLNWSKFIFRRLSRVYPLYLVTVLVIVPFRWGESPHTLIGLALEILLLQAWIPQYPLAFNSPAWAMSVIFSFYLIFPVLYSWMFKKGIRFSIFFTFGVWIITQLSLHILINYWYADHLPLSHDFIYYNPIIHLNTFLFGITGSMVL